MIQVGNELLLLPWKNATEPGVEPYVILLINLVYKAGKYKKGGRQFPRTFFISFLHLANRDSNIVV